MKCSLSVPAFGVTHSLPPVLIPIGVSGLTCSHQKIFFCVYITFVSLKNRFPWRWSVSQNGFQPAGKWQKQFRFCSNWPQNAGFKFPVAVAMFHLIDSAMGC